MKAADPPMGGHGSVPLERRRAHHAEEARGMRSGARLRAVLLAIAIALIAAVLCAAVGLLLAQEFFGTTGGIL